MMSKLMPKIYKRGLGNGNESFMLETLVSLGGTWIKICNFLSFDEMLLEKFQASD